MKEIFNRRFGKYFIVTFFVILFLNAFGTINHYFDSYIESSVPLQLFCQLSVYVALGLIPAALCVSVALASFISFRNLSPDTETKGFFRKLGIGFICFMPLAITVYLFDLYIQPQLHINTAEILWDMRSGSYFRKIEDDPLKSPGFKNFSPGFSTKDVLYFRIDSLETEYKKLKGEAARLLSQLPDTAATEAYEAYELEWLGVDYQFAHSPTGLEKDNVTHIQQVELYDTAENLHETNIKRLQYRFEGNKRRLNAVGILLQFLIFATLGYLSRKKPIQTILGVIAIIIVAGLFINQITMLGKRYADEANNKAKEYEREMRDRRFIRK